MTKVPEQLSHDHPTPNGAKEDRRRDLRAKQHTVRRVSPACPCTAREADQLVFGKQGCHQKKMVVSCTIQRYQSIPCKLQFVLVWGVGMHVVYECVCSGTYMHVCKHVEATGQLQWSQPCILFSRERLSMEPGPPKLGCLGHPPISRNLPFSASPERI